MAVNPVNLNMFSPSMGAIQGINSTQNPQPIQPTQAVQAGANPFAQKSEENGVGLVNSNLSNMSYTLPNGKQSICNTIGIG